MNQEHEDHDGHRGLIVDDETLDYILYEEITRNDQKRKDGKGGCFSMVALLLLPMVSLVFMSWKC